MSDKPARTEDLQRILDRLAAGDDAAADEMIEHSMARVRRLARKLLRNDPRVGRWEGTDDVLQNACLRLHRALKDVKPTNTKSFFGLAATQIRRELIDLARHHYGPEGPGAHHKTDPKLSDDQGRKASPVDMQPTGSTSSPPTEDMAEFHVAVGKLPDEEREVFERIFYLDMDQSAVAKDLDVSVPTVKRRWRSARVLLHEALHRDAPED